MTTSTNNNSSLRFEPWLDPQYAQDFALTHEQREAGRIRREHAELAPFRSVQIRNEDGVVIRSEEIGGAISFVEGLVIVEAEVEQAETTQEWAVNVRNALARIRVWLPGHMHLFPANPGRHHLARTQNGMRCKLFMLFVPDSIIAKGFVENEAGMIGRMGPLAQHLKPGISFKLAENVTVAAGPNSDSNRYRLFDSLYFFKASVFGDVESNVIKIYGTADIAHLAEKMGHGQPDPVFKGVAVRVPDEHWTTVLEGAGLNPSLTSVGVIACNGKDVKFLRNAISNGITFWQVMPTLDGKVARVTSEERQLSSLLPEFKDRITARRVNAAREIHKAYAAYAEGNVEPLISMVASTISELAGYSESELEQLSAEEREEINTLFNSAGRIRTAIACGLPRFETEVINLIETLIVARIKGVNFKGITRFSLPSMCVSEFGAALKRADMDAHHLKLGDSITDIRYPNTGSSMLTMKLELAHYLDGVVAHPATGKKYQAEDYDGDMSVVLPFASVDNAKITILATKNTDGTREGVTVGSVFLSSSFGKLHIGVTDGAITRLIASGRTELLPEVSECLQALIDMAKKNVQHLLIAGQLLAEHEVPAVPASVRILKGRIGTSNLGRANISSKRSVCVMYPLLLAEAWTDGSCIDELVRPWIMELPMVLSKANSIYTELGRASASWQGEEPDAVVRTFSGYEKLLATAAPEFIFRYRQLDKVGRKAFYEYRDFPAEVAEKNADRIIKGLNKIAADEPKAVIFAHRVAAQYYEHTRRLNAAEPNAYEPINAIKDGIELLASKGKVEIAALGLKYLALCIFGARSPKVMGIEANMAAAIKATPISIKSTSILATLPVLVGTYSLAELVRKLGYQHKPLLKVLSYQDLAQ